MTKHHTKKGFTLVELLVVISIIALLVSILMPALSKARDQAKAIVCATRLKDIGLVMVFYNEENDGDMPYNLYASPDGKTPSRWPYLLAEYYPTVNARLDEWQALGYTNRSSAANAFELYKCTAMQKYAKVPGSAVGTYGYNPFFSDHPEHPSNNDPKKSWRKAGAINSPAELPLMLCVNADPYGTYPGGAGMGFDPTGPHPMVKEYGFLGDPANLTGWGPAPNHGGKCNFLFADGHVKGHRIADELAWPWYGEFDGRAFHPKRNVNKNP